MTTIERRICTGCGAVTPIDQYCTCVNNELNPLSPEQVKEGKRLVEELSARGSGPRKVCALCGKDCFLNGTCPCGTIRKFNLDQVNHPSHYTKGKYEVIEVLEDWKLEPHEWNAVKYIARAEHKGARIQDLEKAAWYLKRKIALLKGNAPRPNDMDKE